MEMVFLGKIAQICRPEPRQGQSSIHHKKGGKNMKSIGKWVIALLSAALALSLLAGCNTGGVRAPTN